MPKLAAALDFDQTVFAIGIEWELEQHEEAKEGARVEAAHRRNTRS